MATKSKVLLGTWTGQVTPGDCWSHTAATSSCSSVSTRGVEAFPAYGLPYLGLYLPILMPGTADLTGQPCPAEQEMCQSMVLAGLVQPDPNLLPGCLMHHRLRPSGGLGTFSSTGISSENAADVFAGCIPAVSHCNHLFPCP